MAGIAPTGRSAVNGVWRTKTVPTLVAERVAIGGEMPYPFLHHMGFTAIVDLRETYPVDDRELLEAFRLFHAPLDDGVAPTPDELAAICRTIDSYRSSFFYVHCFEGIGRAVTVGAAYLMWDGRTSYQEAIGRIVDLRPAANPTRAQLGSLEDFGSVLASATGRSALVAHARPLAPYRRAATSSGS